jgi:hypothetical protein
MHPTPNTALLTYDAAKELLSGTIGSAPQFHMKAYSGGSRGHVDVGARVAARYLHKQASNLSSHLANTPTIKDNHGHYKQRGGTLPAGHYTCQYWANHADFHECIQLKRQADAKAIYSPFSPHPIAHGRGDDFFIHGRGSKGSDGCIVPADPAERIRLNHAVKNFPGKVVLLVKHVSYQLPAELEGQMA